MKLEHKLDPLLQIAKASDSILTFGCFRLTLNFMVKPIGVENLQQLQELMPKLAKACCDVIEEHNRQEDAKCPSSFDTLNPEATKLSDEIPGQ
jgi:hypothetical protein